MSAPTTTKPVEQQSDNNNSMLKMLPSKVTSPLSPMEKRPTTSIPKSNTPSPNRFVCLYQVFNLLGH